MAFFISDALAEAAPAAAGAQDPGLVGMILPLGIMAAFFFLFILPQQRKAKEHKKMIEALGKGSEVVAKRHDQVDQKRKELSSHRSYLNVRLIAGRCV